jgi:hypothetical protein
MMRMMPRAWVLAFASALFLVVCLEAPRAQETKKLTNLELVRQVTVDAVQRMMSDLPPSGKRVRVRVEPYHEAAWLVQDLVGKALRARGCEVVAVPTTPIAPASPGVPAGAAAAQTTPAEPPAPLSGAAAAGAQVQTALGTGSPDSTQTAGAGQSEAAPDSIPATEEALAGSAAPAVGTTGATAEVEKPKAETVPVDAEMDLRVVGLGLRYTDTHRSGFWVFGGTKVERYALASLHAEIHEPENPVIRWSGNGEAKVIDEVEKDDLPILEGQRYPFTAPALPQQGGNRWVEPVIVSAIVIGLVFLFVSNKS